MDRGIEDTIVAISTAPGRSALSLVRISGRRAIAIADQIFQGRVRVEAMADHTLQHGYIVSQRGERIDEVMLALLKGPHSYTGEDTVEITGHGGNAVASAIVEVAVLAGARPARPGEFTLRAFLQEKMDLSQAEAVAEIIEADTWAAARAALERLGGGLSKRIEGMKADLIEVLTQLEAAVDFPEEDLPRPVIAELQNIIERAQGRIAALIEASRTAQILRQGARVVIAGRPNTGKSSLFNLLLREERAIVTEHPGTTRDVIEGFVEIRGLPVRIFDTAGVREPADGIEALGVERAQQKLAQADLVLLVIDGSQPPRAEDRSLLEQTLDYPRLVLLNKSDLKPAFAAQRGWIRISALKGTGLGRLEEAMVSALTKGRGLEESGAAAANMRQAEALQRSLHSLKEAALGLSQGRSYEMVAADVRAAVLALDEITGAAWRGGAERNLDDQILENIFSKFCIGK